MKKILSFFLAISIIATLSACGNDATTKKSVLTDKSSSANSGDDNTQNTDNGISTKIPGKSGATGNGDFLWLSNDSETTVSTPIPTPGTENWSDAQNAYTLTVSNETIGNFEYYSWYIGTEVSSAYAGYSAEEKAQLLEYIFEDQKVNLFNFMIQSANYYYPGKGCNIDSFKDSMKWGQGGLIDEIIRRNIPIMITIDKIPSIWRGQGGIGIKEQNAADFAKMMANLIYDLRVECGLNVIFSSLDDEPDNVSIEIREHATLDHYRLVLPLLRKELDKRGLKNVMLTGMEICQVSNATVYPIKYNEIRENLFAFSAHDANNGNFRLSLLEQKLFYNLPVFQTSSCAVRNETLAGDYYTIDDNGQDVVNDYYCGLINISSLINNVNMGANVFTMWQPLNEVGSMAELDGRATNFTHMYHNPSMFSNGFALTAANAYYTQALQTVKPKANIYLCKNNVDQEMRGAFSHSHMNANAGRNTDGTWGLNILNKTDSQYFVGKQLSALPAETLTVNIDIVGLYGTGAQEFKIFSTNTSGDANREVGSITLVDGRGNLEVYPGELISLRSVSSIDLNNKPVSITNKIKNLNVFCAGKDYAFIKGVKTNIATTPRLTDSFTSIMFDAAVFAQAVDCEYEIIGGNTVNIWNDYGMITLKTFSNLLTYSGTVTGSVALESTPYIQDGKIYFELSDAVSASISKMLNIGFKQYSMTGLVVVGNNDVINTGRFAKLFS